MTVIMIGAVIIFIISFIWIWHNMGNIEKTKKIAFIIIGTGIMYLLTLIIYNIASPNITYPSEEIKQAVNNVLMIVFTGLNTLIFLPWIANLLDKILEEEIDKDQARTRIIVLLVILILCIFIEKGYLESTQEGIINIYNNEVQNAEK